MGTNYFCAWIIVTLTLTLIKGDKSNESLEGQDDTDLELSSLKKGRTRRTLWLDKKRRLILPPDTSLSITPVLAFPVFKESSTWVAFENLQISWTFLILFQGLGWTSEENAWPLDVSYFLPNMSDSSDEASSSTRRQGQGPCAMKRRSALSSIKKESGCGRSIPVMALPTNSPGGERALLFPRIETFLTSFGLNGRACLKRAVCEVHEIPMKEGFGMLGEFLTLFLSVSQSPYASSHLPGYLNAERAGKFGDCSKYHTKCPYSIFTSK